MIRSTLIAGLFLLSGACGLVYQSSWSHYLALLLGHAAYAQATTLVLFMGGLAVGAWLAARCLPGIRRPLLAYGVAEALLGVAALLFHALFVAAEAQLFGPWLAASGATTGWLLRLATATLLVLPPALLLGATFPLLAAALLRNRPAQGGRIVAWLYAVNSAGAALGALLATFVLQPAWGLPGTLGATGLANLGIGAVAIALGWADSSAPETRSTTAPDPSLPAVMRLLVLAAAVTGLTSLVCELAWIRMLALVLGSSQHAFELMLATFIGGLTLGAWWIRRRLRGEVHALLRTAGRIQVAMALATLATLPWYAASFDAMAALLRGLARTDSGYVLFNVASAAIAAAILLPAALCAGMTLPALSQALRRSGGGEAAVGRIYAANTLGAIGGVLSASLWLLPALGLKATLWSAALVDLLLGVLLLSRPGKATRWRLALGSGLLCAGLAWALASFDPRRMTAGVFRSGQAKIGAASEVLFHADGRTATVGLHGDPDGLLILSTNGKPDAGLQMDPTRAASGDEPTMVLLGLLGLAAHPAPREIAVIGFGSGLTTHVLLASPRPRRVRTLEIEPMMIEAARGFGARVARAYDDPRAEWVIEDARAVLAGDPRRYDLIVAEPSNPWVQGVAALFTREFYRRLPARLQPGGLLVQWVHGYELDDAALLSILRALGESFPHYAVWASNHADYIILARADGPLPALSDTVYAEPRLAAEAARVGLHTAADLALRRVAERVDVERLIALYQPPVHSDYAPFVADRAPRERFKRTQAVQLSGVALAPLAAQIRRPQPQVLPALEQTTAYNAHPLVRERRARLALAALLDGRTPQDGEPGEFDAVRTHWQGLRHAAADCFAAWPSNTARNWLLEAYDALAGVLPPAALAQHWARSPWAACTAHAPAETAALLELLADAGDPDQPADTLIVAALTAMTGLPERQRGVLLALALTRVADATPGTRQRLREALERIGDPLLHGQLWSRWD